MDRVTETTARREAGPAFGMGLLGEMQVSQLHLH